MVPPALPSAIDQATAGFGVPVTVAWKRAVMPGASVVVAGSTVTWTFETTRTYIRGGDVREIRYRVRCFMPDEIREWLLAAGFAEVDLRGYEGEPFTPESRRVIAVARAPA